MQRKGCVVEEETTGESREETGGMNEESSDEAMVLGKRGKESSRSRNMVLSVVGKKKSD